MDDEPLRYVKENHVLTTDGEEENQNDLSKASIPGTNTTVDFTEGALQEVKWRRAVPKYLADYIVPKCRRKISKMYIYETLCIQL